MGWDTTAKPVRAHKREEDDCLIGRSDLPSWGFIPVFTRGAKDACIHAWLLSHQHGWTRFEAIRGWSIVSALPSIPILRIQSNGSGPEKAGKKSWKRRGVRLDLPTHLPIY